MNNINLLSANWLQLLVKIRTTSLQFLCQYNPLYKILLSENLYANTIKHSPRQFIGGIKNPLPMKPAVLKVLTFVCYSSPQPPAKRVTLVLQWFQKQKQSYLPKMPGKFNL